jgi:TolB protein
MKRSVGATVVSAASLALCLAAAEPAHATFPGSNGRIAFRRVLNASGTRGAIFTIYPDGSRERQLTHPHGARRDTEPNWSPNGRWIIYAVWHDGNEGDSDVFKIRADGSHRTKLDASCTTPCQSDEFPAWSPTGEQIVLQRSLGPSIDQENLTVLFVMRADGTNAAQLTQVGADPNVEQAYGDHDPTWSPDGQRIAFERIRFATDHHAIFTVRIDGTGLRQLTPWRLDAASPDWSPSGRWIAFRTQETSDTHGDLGLVRPTGKHRHLVTSGSGKWGLLSFSPDGRHIASTFSDDVLYAMRVDGTHLRPVVSDAGIPGWGPRAPSS